MYVLVVLIGRDVLFYVDKTTLRFCGTCGACRTFLPTILWWRYVYRSSLVFYFVEFILAIQQVTSYLLHTSSLKQIGHDIHYPIHAHVQFGVVRLRVISHPRRCSHIALHFSSVLWMWLSLILPLIMLWKQETSIDCFLQRPLVPRLRLLFQNVLASYQSVGMHMLGTIPYCKAGHFCWNFCFLIKLNDGGSHMGAS